MSNKKPWATATQGYEWEPTRLRVHRLEGADGGLCTGSTVARPGRSCLLHPPNHETTANRNREASQNHAIREWTLSVSDGTVCRSCHARPWIRDRSKISCGPVSHACQAERNRTNVLRTHVLTCIVLHNTILTYHRSKSYGVMAKLYATVRSSLDLIVLVIPARICAHGRAISNHTGFTNDY
jgi:hypothetical protein